MENDDKPLLELQQKFSGLLKLFSHLCEKSKKRTDILEERFKNETIDANTTEEMGIILIEMLKKVKGNLSFLIDSLEKDFNEANQNRTPKLYNDIFTKLLDYRTSVVSVDDNHEYKFVRLGDEETIAVGEDSFRTSIPCLSSTSDLDRTITLENLKGNLPVQSCPSNEVPQDDVVVMSSRNEIDSGSIKESSSTKSEKRYSLSLKNVEGSDGQDTDDSWRDTYGPIHVKPKLSPKEATCDEAHDVDTIKDIILDSNVDDIFEDGHSIPRNGENKSEMDIERECLKSEDGIDMIFSESPTLIATNPENLENGNSNISIAEAQEIEEQENKEKENSNNKTCNESNTICEPQKEIPSGADGKTGGSTNFNWHNSTSSSEESDGSFETVLLSNNDSQSPLKATEIGTRILKIPVEVSKNLEVSVEMKEATKILSETDESSIDSTASSYTIDSTMQITKKNKSKPSKSLPSSQEIETPEPPQSPVAKELEGSDSGNITNSESSTSSDGTERSSSSLTTSSESTKSWSPVYQNATRNSDSIQASGVFDVTSGLDDMDTQAVKNKESSHEIFKSPTSSGDGISCDSGNPRSEAFENLVECEKGENIDSDATEIGGEETEENGANSDVSLERDQHDEDCNAEIGANEESDESDVPLEKPDQQDENPSGESETSRDSIYLEPTQKISKKPKIRIDIEKVQPEKVEDTLPRCSFDIPREGCISDSDTLESNQSDVSDQQTPESVINETKCNEDYENQSCKNKEPVESESNEKDMITHEIENPYSVETVKVDSDEDMDDSQSSKMSEKGSDFLNEHNYSCASVSDIEDSSKDRIVSKPEIEDTDSRETENNGVTEKEESEFDIEDDSDETVELNTNQKINENELDSPLSPPMENLSGNEDSKNSHSDYIHSEHNYSSGASPNPHISSSDTDEDVRNKLISEDMDKHDDAGKGNDIDSDETDIEREINEGIVDESVEIKSIPDLDEISDSQEEVALSQKSTLSYEFDISENTKRLEDLNDALAENENKGTTQECNEDEKKAEDIARELENLLSEEICENKLEDDADSTSDIDDTDEAKSLSPKTSTSEPSALGSIENEKTEAGTAQCAEYNEKEESSELLNCNVDTSESLLDITMEEILSDSQKEERSELVNCNVDSSESLLDVTMEEILSDSQKVGETAADSQNTIILDYDDIKPKLEIIKIEDTELEESKPLVMNQNNIGDEILELLKEVPIPCLENTNVTAKSPSVEDASDEQTEADNILKMLEQDSFDDSSESYNDDDIHLWSDSSIDDVAEKVIDLSENKLQQALKQNDMADCYVEIERLQLPEKDLIKYTRKLEDDVDWLCDLGNLHKRKFDISLPFEKFKRVKKKHRGKSSTSRNSFDTSDSSNDSDVELCGYRSGTPLLPKPIGQKLDDFIANGICRDLRSSSSSSSDGSGDDTDSSTKKKSRSNVDNETDTEEGSGKDKNNRRKELSKEELRKKAWKHDPLLRGKLSSSSDSSGSDVSKAKRKRQRYEHDTEFTVASENLDESDSDMADMCEKNKSKLEEKLISPIKRNLPSSDSSDSDSDCEFVSQKMRSPLKDGDAAGPGPSQKGRRNIRALMSQELLAEATKKANKEEMERIERLKDRNKVIESFSQSFTNSQSSLEEDAVPPFVLDFDNKTGEPLIQVHEKITALLKPHQRKGVQFMWDSCYESVDQLQKHEGSGCILGHCMGLGKTLQVLTLIHTLFTHEVTNTKHVLVVCPLSTVNNWKKERKFAWKGIPEAENISVLTIVKQRTEDRFDIVKKWRRTNKKSILVLGYETFQTLTNETKMNNMNLRTKKQILEALIDPGPDLVICDEGHLLRNKDSLKSLALIKIRSQRRIVLTGTPLQNNLLEYYHMVEIVKPNLLGNIKEFQTNFINPITNGQYEDSTEGDIKLMMKRTHVLHRLLAKTIQRIEDTELEIYLPKMMDHAVFIRLNQLQVNLYNHFSDIAKENMDKKQHKGFLSDFLIFQHICTHPHLLALVANKNRKTKRIEEDIITIEEEKPLKLGNWWKDKVPKDADSKIEYGNKLVVLRSIIEECEDIEDKVLVFSQCLSELDLIEHFLNTVGTRKCPSWKKKVDYSRMDGTVSIEDRSLICDIFNDTENVKMRLLLMSTKVGGLGLNLTAANRVIIMTVNWNPSYDTQSVFRVYRFGQQKEVFVYRLIALDTMEEKVYQRSVTKLAIAHRVVDQHQITRHYPRKQELYSCRPSADEERPMPKLPEDQMLAKLLFQLPCIYRCHEHKALLANRPEDNLSADELASAWDAWLNNENANPALPRVQIAPPPEAQRQPPSGTLAQRQPPPSTLAQRYPAPGALLQRYIPPGSRLLVMPPPGTLAQRHHPPGTLAQIQPPPSRHPSWTQARRHRSPWTLVQRHPSPGTLAQRHPPPLIPTQRLPSSITSPPVPNAKETLCMFENSFRSNQVPSRRVSDSSREDNSREYFTPTSKIGTPSADIPNRENIKLPSKEKLKSIPSTNVNLQSTTDTGQQFVINSVEHAAIIDQILAMSKAEFEVNKDSRVGVQLSPTIPEANRISIASEDISRLSSNLSGPSLGGKQQRSGPLTSGGTNVHKNTNKTPLMVMDRKLVQSPFDVGIKNVPNPFSRNMPKQNRPNNTPSGARDGGSVQKPGPSTGLNKKGIPQRVGRALKGGEPIKKKPTNENSVPTPQRRNITNKRKYEEIADKKRKNSSQLPSSGNQAHQVVNADYRPNPCKKNRISSNENSTVSINVDDIVPVASSESGLLSNKLIKNFKFNGVSIRKTSSSRNDVITLE